MPEGVLTFSNKECLHVGPAQRFPQRRRAVPPAPGVQFLQVDIQTKVHKIQELLENSDFEKNTSGKRARLFAENFDARLAGIVI